MCVFVSCLFQLGLQVIGNSTVVVGQPANISCSTDLKISSLQWVFIDDVVASSTTQQVELQFLPVYDFVHNRVYTCRATSAYGIQELSITITVIGKFLYS